MLLLRISSVHGKLTTLLILNLEKTRDQENPATNMASESRPRYRYSSLSGSEIRVLRLQPGTGNKSLQGRLLHVDLDTQPLYTTASYAWGKPIFSERIEIDSQEVAITATLFCALKHARLSKAPIDLWADAISINQANIDERNSQVTMMSRIFRQCQKCVVSLGEEADNSEIIPSFWRELISSVLNLGKRPGFTFGSS